MSTIRDYLLSIRKQFTTYFITGLSAFVLDISTLVLFKEVFHWRPFFAVIINQIFATIFVFSLNKYWTFKTKSQTRSQIFRFMIVYTFNYTFAIVWMWLGNEKFGQNYLIVRIANIILSVSWNFLLYKYFVYAHKRIGASDLPAVSV